MKVIIFGNTIKNLMNFRRNLILNFIEKNHEIYLIFQKEFNNRDHYNFFLQRGCKMYEIYFDRHGLNPIKEFITFVQVFRLYNKIKPDIAFHFTIKPNIYGSIVTSLCRAYSINNITGMGYFFLREG